MNICPIFFVRSRLAALILPLVATGACAQGGIAAAEMQRARIAFLRCAACHTLQAGEAHKTGPNLHLAIGAPAAQVPGYNYSAALRNAGLSWDDATLRRWIQDPATLVPGTSMTYVNTLGDSEITALLTFLRSQTAVR